MIKLINTYGISDFGWVIMSCIMLGSIIEHGLLGIMYGIWIVLGFTLISLLYNIGKDKIDKMENNEKV